MEASELAAEIEQYPWYHTLDLGNGVITKGLFDHRGQEGHYLIPDSLAGMRCLDVGTMDGFWALTMEKRGAAEVVALDLEDPNKLDWPTRYGAGIKRTMDETKETRFNLVRSALGSNIKRELRSVYEIDEDLGMFDLVFCGDLLVHLKDPMTALERIRRVSAKSAIVCNPIKEQWPYRNRALAQFNGVTEFEWWVTNMAGLERWMFAAGFERVERGKPFDIRAAAGGDWRGRRGAVRGYV